MRRRSPALLLILALAALAMSVLSSCGGSSSDSEAKSDPTPTSDASATTTAGDPTETTTGGGGGGDGLDVCSWYSTDQASKALGQPVSEASAGVASGSLLGQCKYVGDDGGVISISARPTAEYEASAKATGGTEVSGVGKAAVFSDSGMLVEVDGADYFVHVIAMPSPGSFGDEAMLTSIAKDVLANL